MGALAIVVIAAVAACVSDPALVPAVEHVRFTDSLLIAGIALFAGQALLTLVHESFHVLAGRRLGLRTGVRISRRFYYVVLETRLDGLVSVPRRRRYLVILAGLLADILVLSALVVAAAMTSGTLRGLFLALAFRTLPRIVWQFFFYLRTDVYYLITTALGLDDLDAAGRQRLRELVRRSGPATPVLGERDRRAARWYAPLMVAGYGLSLTMLVLVVVPLAAHFFGRRCAGWPASPRAPGRSARPSCCASPCSSSCSPSRSRSASGGPPGRARGASHERHVRLVRHHDLVSEDRRCRRAPPPARAVHRRRLDLARGRSRDPRASPRPRRAPRLRDPHRRARSRRHRGEPACDADVVLLGRRAHPLLCRRPHAARRARGRGALDELGRGARRRGDRPAPHGARRSNGCRARRNPRAPRTRGACASSSCLPSRRATSTTCARRSSSRRRSSRASARASGGAEADAYEALGGAQRARLHDARADELEARGDRSLELGAIAFHREHGSDPAAGVAALRSSLEHCLLLGCYDAVLELCPRALSLMDWANSPRECWLVVAKWATALTAIGRADEASALYDDACSRTVDPLVHLQAAYGRAMLYTRFYEPARRDHAKAKAEINAAIAISSLLDDERRRTLHLTFNENGLALIEMHLGDLHEALRLVDAGLERIEREFAPGEHALYRSVLRYNRAQLLTRVEGLPAAIEEYGRLIDEDPNYSEYRFNRAALHRKLGRYDEALADLDDAIRLSPPYPEAYYNRADLALERGERERAVADFSRVLELDPEFPDARLNRASALLELGDVDGAERDVAAGLAVAPGDAHLHALRGDLLALRGKVGEADAAYATALERDASLVGAWSNRAVLAFERGEVPDAIDLLTRALDGGGPDPTILANRALAYERAECFADAAADLVAALEHEADPDERAELEARLQALRAR